VRGQRHAPAALYPRERSGTHCTGGWVGSRASLDTCGKSRPPPTGIRSPARPARSQSLYRIRYPAHNVHILITLYLAATFVVAFMSSSVCSHPWHYISIITTTWIVADVGMRKVLSWFWVNLLCWWLRSLGKWLCLPGWPIGTLSSSSLFTKATSLLTSILFAFKIRFFLGKSIISYYWKNPSLFTSSEDKWEFWQSLTARKFNSIIISFLTRSVIPENAFCNNHKLSW
jgi:hypothetical protein